MTALSLQNVSIYAPSRLMGRDNKLLVDSVSCDVSAGEILGIIGPNGAGKSTLLKAITGEWSYSGVLEIPGIETDIKLRARQLAVLPQLSLLNFPYRVSEVVGLGRIPHQTGYHRDREIVSEALALMDIRFLADRIYTELSGGEKQRVQLARVFAQIWDATDAPNNTRLLLLDEPTTALDLGHQQDLMNAVQAFAKRGVTVIMVLHDINIAARYADKLLALLCSQVVAHGKPNDVITQENINRLYNINVQIMNHPHHNTPVVVGI